ncbi:hypothetical protein [Actinacidiphila epipremni]|uniref:PLP-dependent aminotransferase family protein n=1 Tax=Actinacidiphila epipremni TaxID=2053013 RepID=A0ABX0ZGE8_9ACTN|nr:hypothetical protein [Actinacidiphila epipremni]NJP42889.1 hypothetical protein [Actinacidiphila epipremni]
MAQAADSRGVALSALASYRHPQAPSSGTPGDGLVVGYVAPPDHAFGAALEALCGVLPRG